MQETFITTSSSPPVPTSTKCIFEKLTKLELNVCAWIEWASLPMHLFYTTSWLVIQQQNLMIQPLTSSWALKEVTPYLCLRFLINKISEIIQDTYFTGLSVRKER